MSARNPFDLESVPPEQRQLLADFEARMKAWNDQQLLEAPEALKRVANIIRMSVMSGSLNQFRKFLLKEKIDVPSSKVRDFRDFLITRRLDLKDLEPGARARLRIRALENQNRAQMTKDYRDMLFAKKRPVCSECRYFVTAPNDGDGDDASKSCVALGTKGADLACYGYRLPPN